MRLTSKGQITVPREVREELGLYPTVTEIEFQRDESGRWYLRKAGTGADSSSPSRFRTAHRAGRLRLGTDEIMALTRGD